jgi:hypothetical protein
MNELMALRSGEEMAAMSGKNVEEGRPFFERKRRVVEVTERE